MTEAERDLRKFIDDTKKFAIYELRTIPTRNDPERHLQAIVGWFDARISDMNMTYNRFGFKISGALNVKNQNCRIIYSKL